MLSIAFLFSLICGCSTITSDPDKEEIPTDEIIRFSDDSSGFVLLSEAVPDVILEIRFILPTIL